MKRYISKYDDENYTHMLKLIYSIGGRSLKYNWLITEIEAYPSDEGIHNILNNDYVILSNDEVLDMLEKEDFQWIWGTFSAIPANIKDRDILQYSSPSPNNITLTYNSDIAIQHPLAEIEIDCVDSSLFVIIFKDDNLEGELLKAYSSVLTSIESLKD